MLLVVMTLAQLLASCATGVHPQTMTAIVSVESGGNTLAIHDNSTGQTYNPVDMREAALWARQLIDARHNIDMGLAQINSSNLALTGLNTRTVFDPCQNLRAAARILGNAYAQASAAYGPGQYALRRALSVYNSGSMFAGQNYVDRILAAAGVGPDPTAPPVRPRSNTKTPKPVPTPKPPYTDNVSSGGVEVINGHP